MKTVAIAVLLCFACDEIALAQGIYKCKTPTGSITLSDRPCDAGAIQLSAPSATSAMNTSLDGRTFKKEGEPLIGTDRERELCVAALTKFVAFKDPASVKVDGTAYIGYEYANSPQGRHLLKKYDMLVNAKNSYGGYTGVQAYDCYLREDGSQVVTIRPPSGK